MNNLLPNLYGADEDVAKAEVFRLKALRKFPAIKPLMDRLTDAKWWLSNSRKLHFPKIWLELSEGTSTYYELCSQVYGSSLKKETEDFSSSKFPELEGSDRQINWGEHLRQVALSENYSSVIPWISTFTEASWWIFYRGDILDKAFWDNICTLQIKKHRELAANRKAAWYAKSAFTITETEPSKKMTFEEMAQEAERLETKADKIAMDSEFANKVSIEVSPETFNKYLAAKNKFISLGNKEMNDDEFVKFVIGHFKESLIKKFIENIHKDW